MTLVGAVAAADSRCREQAPLTVWTRQDRRRPFDGRGRSQRARSGCASWSDVAAPVGALRVVVVGPMPTSRAPWTVSSIGSPSPGGGCSTNGPRAVAGDAPAVVVQQHVVEPAEQAAAVDVGAAVVFDEVVAVVRFAVRRGALAAGPQTAAVTGGERDALPWRCRGAVRARGRAGCRIGRAVTSTDAEVHTAPVDDRSGQRVAAVFGVSDGEQPSERIAGTDEQSFTTSIRTPGCRAPNTSLRRGEGAGAEQRP